MLSMRIDILVAGLVRQELQGKRRKDEALYFNFDIGMSHHTSEKSYNERCGLHLLYHCSPGSSYITVFSGVTKSPFGKIKDVQSWEHESTHDSCWGDIRVFSNVYFGMAEKINAMLKEDGKETIAPVVMNEHNSCPAFSVFYKWVPVKVSYDETDDHHYRRMIEIL